MAAGFAHTGGIGPCAIRSAQNVDPATFHKPPREGRSRPSGRARLRRDLLVRVNGWDPAVLQRFLGDEVIRGSAELSTGSAHSVAAIRNQLSLGGDGVIMHGSTPDELRPIIAEYRRPAEAT